ncbi:MAG: Pyruvate phosphate dikinase [Deltaproteobacteria bacterium]|nr:Pyruvate phosphate dikinase [Deltaproteobacteria bacterium]
MSPRFWVLSIALVVACKTKPEPASQPAAAAVMADARIAAATPADAEIAARVVPETAPALRMWTAKLGDAETFESYSKEIGNERFAKFVIDLKSDAIYYFDVNVYPVHKDFIFQELYKKPRTKQANRLFDRNYGADKTDFIMCYLVHHLSQDQWTFAFWDGDKATPAHVRHAYQRMKDTFFLGDKVRFRPDSNYQEKVANRTPEVPHVKNDELYKLADYTAFNTGIAVGTLRIVPPDVSEADLTFAPDEIVVLRTSLADITPVAGIISETFSTPLSHVSLRAKGWRIPSVGLRDAQRKLAELAGQPVYFEAKDAAYVLRAATDAEIAAEKIRREARPTITIPTVNLEVSELTTLVDMRAKDHVVFGPKAANLGEIKHANLPGFSVPEGFGIPFRYYDEHLKAAGLDKTITGLLADPAVAKDPNVRKQQLEALRKAIEAGPFSPELRTKVEAGLTGLDVAANSQGVFVRSSTNAEDLDNFSGAGLHDTKPNVKGLDAVCDAIKSVWASTWTVRAYDARDHAGIDQTKVYGSALVQIGVPATAAGVIATVHPTDPTDERNYTINAKSGLGMAVVDGRKVPESLLVSWYNKGMQLTKLFGNPKLDIEWVYVGDELFIVQTRPLVGL